MTHIRKVLSKADSYISHFPADSKNIESTAENLLTTLPNIINSINEEKRWPVATAKDDFKKNVEKFNDHIYQMLLASIDTLNVCKQTLHLINQILNSNEFQIANNQLIYEQTKTEIETLQAQFKVNKNIIDSNPGDEKYSPKVDVQRTSLQFFGEQKLPSETNFEKILKVYATKLSEDIGNVIKKSKFKSLSPILEDLDEIIGDLTNINNLANDSFTASILETHNKMVKLISQADQLKESFLATTVNVEIIKKELNNFRKQYIKSIKKPLIDVNRLQRMINDKNKLEAQVNEQSEIINNFNLKPNSSTDLKSNHQ